MKREWRKLFCVERFQVEFTQRFCANVSSRMRIKQGKYRAKLLGNQRLFSCLYSTMCGSSFAYLLLFLVLWRFDTLRTSMLKALTTHLLTHMSEMDSTCLVCEIPSCQPTSMVWRKHIYQWIVRPGESRLPSMAEISQVPYENAYNHVRNDNVQNQKCSSENSHYYKRCSIYMVRARKLAWVGIFFCHSCHG